MSGFKPLWPYFKRYKWIVLSGFAALLICDLAKLGLPTILGSGIDLLLKRDTVRRDLLIPVAQIIGLTAAMVVTRYAWRTLILGFSRRVVRGLRQRLYDQMVHLPPRWHLENVSGDLMAMATNDMDNIRLAVSTGLIIIIDTSVLGFMTLSFMAAISPTMTLWALLPLPAITLFARLMGRRLYRAVLQVQDVFGTLTELVRERLTGLRVIRAMSLTSLTLEETERAGRVYLRKSVLAAAVSGLFYPFLHLMTNVAVVLTIYFGGRETVYGHVSAGDFVAFIGYLAILTYPLTYLGMITGYLQQGRASLARLDRVYSAAAEPDPDLAAPADPHPDIEMTGLSFRYPSRTAPALDRVTLRLTHDKFTALIGPTGGGKSTLAALLPAICEAPEKTMKVAGLEVENWPLRRLRALFGYVPQNAFLFSGTIRDNLAFGRPEAGEDILAEAVATAGLAEDLASFPQGLDTVVGERGLTLSGGQRQRLALARALVTDPLYLILDDTFSAVDAAVEAEIMGRLLARGRGALVISHRAASLLKMDEVIVLEEGRVTGRGSPTELMGREGYFNKIIEMSRLEETQA